MVPGHQATESTQTYKEYLDIKGNMDAWQTWRCLRDTIASRQARHSKGQTKDADTWTAVV